ncbi:hypothetical protein IFO70_03950 [Phormidium tenue FACHB-886]|nr:hypothetical protein [Phormidium tenue FACHB-886]
MPKFADTIAWQQAELLMQPTFIRVIDNLGKRLEESNWKGTYEDIPVWAEGVSEETKAIVRQLQEQLKIATPEQAVQIEEALARLPQPAPGYLLRLEKGSSVGDSTAKRQITIDIWQLCYQICFRNYSPVLNAMDNDFKVEIDTTLIDETGDVDWLKLDTKAKQLIGQIFSSLPT